MYRCTAIFVGLFVSLHVQAQFVNYGSDPARLKWNAVDLEHYKLIYPQGCDSMAYRYALYLEHVYPHLLKTMGTPIKASFPVILHPASMSANGMVAWTPRRMELLTTPSAGLHAQSWDKHLVLHESRHVIQTGKLMTGIFRPLYYLAGEQVAGVASFFAARWFFEGDAVGIETAMSNGGRGRLPEFHMAYRAQMLSGRFYPFDKWYLGSYKDYTGNYYALGYNMTSFAKYRYGAGIWDKITSRYVRRFYLFPPFPNAIKHHTKASVDDLFGKTFAFLKDEWDKQSSSFYMPDYMSPPTKRYTSYRYPQAANDSAVIAIKSGLHDIDALVMLVNGREKRLGYTGSINSRLALGKGRVYWSEDVPGMRWTHENYSVVKYYDLKSERIVTVTPRGRYLSPAPDESGKTVAVSSVSLAGRNRIVLVDTENGRETAQYDVPDNAFAKELVFGEKGQLITIAVGDKGISLLQLDTQSGRWRELLPPVTANITSPAWRDGTLYFESGLNGTNNIYSLDMHSLQVSRITSARFGAFHPAFSTNGKRLLFSDYQATGYRIASIPADSLLSEAADFKAPYRFALAEAIAGQEQFNLDTASLTPVAFNPKPYRKGAHLFNIHSWAPFYYDISSVINLSTDNLATIVKPGAMIISQNALNTAVAQAGWYYKEGYHHGKLAFTYMGWYPVIDLTVDYGGNAFDVAWATDGQGKETATSYSANRTLLEAEVRMYIPFNLTKNHYTRGIQPSVTYYFTNNRYQQHDSHAFRNFQYLLSELRCYNYRKMSLRDILPRRGYQMRLQYLNTPFNTGNYGSLYAARLTTYWPGVIRNHALMLRLGYQYQPVDSKFLYIPQQLLEAPRGYHYVYQTRQQMAFKADYAFSILCPDLRIGSLAYIKRIRSNLFYDLSRNQAHAQAGWTVQSAAGADLIFDWNVIRMSYPLSSGIRVIKPIDYGRVQTEFLFSINF
ncbi:MAG: hypothetical protein LBQ39_07120 [Tannerellaceae bacterium]|jgi:hypothetical protein|nr:hypothetical protein [Tannerellaceae bacterium]